MCGFTVYLKKYYIYPTIEQPLLAIPLKWPLTKKGFRMDALLVLIK